MAPGARAVPGIGASRRSSFLTVDSFDRRIGVRDAEAMATCRILREDTGIGVGGSTGSVLRACLAELSGPLSPRRPLCLSPDDCSRYEDTVYDDGWLDRTGLWQDVRATIDRFRAEGLSFSATAEASQNGAYAGALTTDGR